jgi:transketolase
MRETFLRTAGALLDEDPRTALVLADISVAGLEQAARAHPDRVLNVGIREQLMVGVAGAVLVSVGASYDASASGRTHHSPADVALFDTLDGWTVHVPGHPDEVGPLLRAAARHDGRVYVRLSSQVNDAPRHTGPHLETVKRGSRAAVIAVGPVLDRVLAATEGLDVTVAYTNTPRPFDGEGVRALGHDAVVLVEPYLAGTSAAPLASALAHVRHRTLHLGVGAADPRRYGSPADHEAWHGLDPAALRRSITEFAWDA